MSNKTQLQTNNTKLAVLIETLRGKAVSGDVKTVYIGTSEPTVSIGVNGDIYIVRSDDA